MVRRSPLGAPPTDDTGPGCVLSCTRAPPFQDGTVYKHVWLKLAKGRFQGYSSVFDKMLERPTLYPFSLSLPMYTHSLTHTH